MRILIVTSKFNYQITHALQRGCCDHLQAQAPAATVETLWVPGAFEIPVIVAMALDKATYSAVICLGAIYQRRNLPLRSACLRGYQHTAPAQR